MSNNGSIQNYNFERMEQSYRRTHDNSVGDTPQRAVHTRKNVPVNKSRKDKWIKLSIAAALGLAVGIGGTLITESALENFTNYSSFNNNPVVQMVNEDIDSHKSRTDDGEKWQLDKAAASQDINKLLDDGADPLIVFAATARNLDEDYAKDELDYITNSAYGMDADSLAKKLDPEHYEDGVSDKDFINDVNNYVAHLNDNSKANAVHQVLSDLHADQSTETKGLGGR